MLARICLAVGLAAALSGCGKPVDMAKAEEALRYFGREEYGKVPGLLEQSGVMQSPKAPMFYFYLGECFYRTNDMTNARIYFKKAYLSPFNSYEAGNRLFAVSQNLHGKFPWRNK
jgi:hypothetical protein